MFHLEPLRPLRASKLAPESLEEVPLEAPIPLDSCTTWVECARCPHAATEIHRTYSALSLPAKTACKIQQQPAEG